MKGEWMHVSKFVSVSEIVNIPLPIPFQLSKEQVLCQGIIGWK